MFIKIMKRCRITNFSLDKDKQTCIRKMMKIIRIGFI